MISGLHRAKNVPSADCTTTVPIDSLLTSSISLARRFSFSRASRFIILVRISDAVADTAPAVRELMQGLAGFKDTGKRMLAAWSEEVRVLRDSRVYGLSPWTSSTAFEGISDPPKLKSPRTVIGRSE